MIVTLDFDDRDQRQQTPAVWAYPTNNTVTPATWDIAMTSFGLGSDPVASQITNFNASMAYLQSQAPALPLADKRMVMSVIGYQLGLGYSATVTNNPSMESIFQNARQGGHDGGICGDIHTYLSLTAPRLGFVAAGTHTTYWSIDATAGGGHVVAHYQDPATGEYYMQNYSQIYATGQNTLQNLLEVSTRILGCTFGSSVESLPGAMHLYVPRQARWVSDLVADQAASFIDEPYLRAGLGNREQSARAQYGWAAGGHQFKGYAVGSRFKADEGTYDCADVGAAYTFDGSVSLGRPWLQEAGTRSTLFASALWMGMPLLRPAPGQPTLRPIPWHRSTGYYGALLSGYLRQRRTMETAEIEGNGSGLQMQSRQEARLSVDHAFESFPIHVYLQRVWDLVDADGQPKKGGQVVTAYDKLGAQLRVQAAKTLTVGCTADAFALGGLDANAGSAVRLGIGATYQTRNAGSFSVADDWGKVVHNRAQDPFYNLPMSHYATIRWQRPLNRLSLVGISAGYGKGPTVQPMGFFGAMTPELNNGSRQITCRIAVIVAL